MPDGQVADVEMANARGAELPDRSGADRLRRGACREFLAQLVNGHRQELAKRLESSWIRRTIVEKAEHPRRPEFSPVRLGEEALNRGPAVVRHDLRQVELGGRPILHQVPDLRRGVAVRVRPPSERQMPVARADHLPELPRVFDAARRTDVLVASEDDEGLEAVMPRAIGVREAELRRVLAGQEGDDVRPGDVAAEIDHKVPEVVLFPEADGAVGEEDEGAGARQAAHGVVGVDPRVHARAGFQLRARRVQLGRDDLCAVPQMFDEFAHAPTFYTSVVWQLTMEPRWRG